MANNFAEKLAIVLKALAISRGRLAADLGVDKSVVSRWLGGLYTPSGENLSHLTRFVAARVPGFTGLHWDRDAQAIAALFGGIAPSGADAEATERTPTLPNLAAVRTHTATYGAGYEGHWWGFRQTFRDHDELVRDKIRIRRRGDFLAIDWRHDTVEGIGWFLVGDGKAYVMLPHRYADIPAIMMFYTVDGKPVQVLDGLVMTVTISAAREMVAAPYVIVRDANLLTDAEADDRYFEARGPDSWTVGCCELPSSVRERLTPIVRAGGMLRLPSDGSLTRFCTPTELAAATVATIPECRSSGGTERTIARERK